MDESGRPPPHPRRGRPAIRIAPRHDYFTGQRPLMVDVATIVWLIALAALAAIIIAVTFKQADVRAAVTDSLVVEHPAIERSDTAATVDAILIGNAVAMLLILTVAVAGIVRVRRRINAGRTMLTVAAGLAVAVGIQLWLISGSAREVVGTVISVLPLAMAGCAPVGSVLLYAPAVGMWLKSAPPHQR